MILVAIAATDLIDGRLARMWRTTSTFGRFADALGDRTMIGCVLVKLALHDALPVSMVWVVACQYVVLSMLIIVHQRRLGAPPPADLWGKLGAAFAAVGGILGLAALSLAAAEIFMWLFVVANVVYFLAVGRRTLTLSQNS